MKLEIDNLIKNDIIRSIMAVEPDHSIDLSETGSQAPGSFRVEIFETPDLAAETRVLPSYVEADLNGFASYLEQLSAAAKANPNGPEAKAFERVRVLADERSEPLGIGEFLGTLATTVAAERTLATESSLRE